MDDQQLTSDYIHDHFRRRRRRSFATTLVTALVFIFVPILRGRGVSPLATILIFILTVALCSIAIVIGSRLAEYSGMAALTVQRAQRPGEPYWQYYRRHLLITDGISSRNRAMLQTIGCYSFPAAW